MRTIYWYTTFLLSLITAYPKYVKAKRLQKTSDAATSRKYIHETSKKWMMSALKRSGATVEVHGLEFLPKDQNVVIVSNHQGNFDIPLLIGYIDIPKGFISKIEAKKIPVISKWMELMNCIFMDRSTLKGSAGAIIEGIKTLKQGHSLVIFPEGTRSRGDKMGEFKAASFKLATKSGIPILPVTIDGSYRLMEKNHNRIKPAHVKLTIHPMVITKGLSKEAMQALPDEVYNTIQSELPH